jgi:hypothetical protein
VDLMSPFNARLLTSATTCFAFWGCIGFRDGFDALWLFCLAASLLLTLLFLEVIWEHER